MIRKFKFTKNTYYHICNRSNDGASIFFDERDYIRLLFLILMCQAPISFYNLGRRISYFRKHSKFNLSQETIAQIVAQRTVELNAFAIMPNHFHIFIQEKTDVGNGVSRYLQRIQTAYAKYFNAKYKKHGHLFQGAFRAVPIETNEQLLYLSAYIHRNPRELQVWKGKEKTYPWSSYQDCIRKNRWEELLKPEIFLNQFSTQKLYEIFIATSTAKLKPDESPVEHLLLD